MLSLTVILRFSDIMPEPELSERLWAEKGLLAFIRSTICPEANSNVKCEMLKTVAAASIQLRLSRQLSDRLIVAYCSTSTQSSDDFNEFLSLLESMLDLVLLRSGPSAHFGKELHRAELVGEFDLAALRVVGLRQSVINGYFRDGSFQNLHQVLNRLSRDSWHFSAFRARNSSILAATLSFALNRHA
jgi:hypothetical protein